MATKRALGRAFKITKRDVSGYGYAKPGRRPNPPPVTAIAAINGRGAYARSAKSVMSGLSREDRLRRARAFVRGSSRPAAFAANRFRRGTKLSGDQKLAFIRRMAAARRARFRGRSPNRRFRPAKHVRRTNPVISRFKRRTNVRRRNRRKKNMTIRQRRAALRNLRKARAHKKNKRRGRRRRTNARRRRRNFSRKQRAAALRNLRKARRRRNGRKRSKARRGRRRNARRRRRNVMHRRRRRNSRRRRNRAGARRRRRNSRRRHARRRNRAGRRRRRNSRRRRAGARRRRHARRRNRAGRRRRRNGRRRRNTFYEAAANPGRRRRRRRNSRRRHARRRRNGRSRRRNAGFLKRLFRRNSGGALGAVKAAFATGALVVAGFAAHKALSKVVGDMVLSKLFGAPATPVTAPQPAATSGLEALQPYKGLIAGGVTAGLGIVLANMFIKDVRTKMLLSAGMAASFLHAVLVKGLSSFGQDAAAGYLAGYDEGTASRLSAMYGLGAGASIMPQYAAINGLGEYFSEPGVAGLGEYFSERGVAGLGEYFTDQPVAGLGNYTGNPDLAEAAAGVGDTRPPGGTNHISPHGDLDRELSIAEAAAGVGAVQPYEASAGFGAIATLPRVDTWVPGMADPQLWAGVRAVSKPQAATEMTPAGILQTAGGQGVLG